jgi:uncharacterized protein (DUF58 family)
MWHEGRVSRLFRRAPAEADTPTVQLFPARRTTDQLLRRLNWQLIRPLASYLGGNERSQFLGAGVEFSELRTYQAGDDIRFIDWNVSARMEQPMLREAHVERSVDVWFLLDMSASTQWGTADCLKWERAVEFTAVAGQLLNRAGNRLGALLFAEQPLKLIPPDIGHLHLMYLLAQLSKQETTMHSGVTDLAAVLTKADCVLRRRSLLLVVSDFLVADTWQVVLGKLAQRHEVVAVRLVDPREGDLPDVGLVTLEDPETGRQLHVDTSNYQLRMRFKRAAQQQADKLHAELVACGAEVLQLRTDEDLMASLLRFLRMRQAHQIFARGRHAVSSGRLAVSSVNGKGDA